ncbi:major facilitator superfamily domain-containing protein [Paraphoma chrysanthemicola]|nr:major facilitator superfamily domain-containing protein [Paraphoma chrysanthemicola]
MEKTDIERHEVASDDSPHGIVLYGEDGNPRLFPVPSAHPDDPLNFSVWKQRLVLFTVCLFAISGFGVVQTTPLFFGKLIPEYKRQTRGSFDASRIVDLASYPSLCMGIGNFLFVPLSMALGRRCAFLLNNALLLAAVVWAATSTSFESHLGARCLQGLTAGVSDCLLPIIVLDISFLHLRGFRMTLYWTLTAVGSSLLLVPIPFMIESAHGNWRVAYWFWASIIITTLLLVIFCFPETLFQRQVAAFSDGIHATDSYGTHRVFVSADEAKSAGFIVPNGDEDGPLQATSSSYGRQLLPYKVQPKPLTRFLCAYKDMALCLLVPGTLWAFAFNSIVFGGIVVLSVTYAERLEMAPWHFSSSTVGTVQLGSAFGALCALAAGASTERISRILTKRNGGVREPEHILPNFVLPTIFASLGLVLYGVVAGNPEAYSWFGVHAAFTLFYCGFCGISAMTIVWLGELLPHMSGPAIVLVCGGRNAVSFGYSSSFNRWLAGMGFRDTYILFGGILCALGLIALPLFFMNGNIRRAMRPLTWLK